MYVSRGERRRDIYNADKTHHAPHPRVKTHLVILRNAHSMSRCIQILEYIRNIMGGNETFPINRKGAMWLYF